jgi:hypothetical protein
MIFSIAYDVTSPFFIAELSLPSDHDDLVAGFSTANLIHNASQQRFLWNGA